MVCNPRCGRRTVVSGRRPMRISAPAWNEGSSADGSKPIDHFTLRWEEEEERREKENLPSFAAGFFLHGRADFMV